MRALVLAMLLAGCSSAAAASGIGGRVLAGPTCPVQRIPPDPACADRPIAIDLVIVDGGGKTAATVRTDNDGRFRVGLAPGRYVIRSAGGRLPSMRDTEVVVNPNHFTAVELHADTGIR